MKAKPAEMAKALDAPPAHIRLFLLHGPEESEIRALAARLGKALGSDAEKVELDSATLKADPARLADEAASFSLFGGKRYILAQIDSDVALPAVAALLDSEVGGNPVVALAGALKPASALLKRALADPAALCCACYEPSAQDLERIATSLAQERGLRIDREMARELVRLSGHDRAVMAQEIEKLALYLDAGPEHPASADMTQLAAISADNDEGEIARLVDAVMDGNAAAAAGEGARLAGEGMDAVPVLRALARRIQLLATIKARQAGGEPLSTLLAPVFWKDKAVVERQLGRWDATRLARAAERVGATERAVFQSHMLGEVLASHELLTIARAAQRAR